MNSLSIVFDVWVGYQSCRAFDLINVNLCYKCGKYNLKGKDYRNETKCQRCSGKHQTKVCKNKDTKKSSDYIIKPTFPRYFGKVDFHEREVNNEENQETDLSAEEDNPVSAIVTETKKKATSSNDRKNSTASNSSNKQKIKFKKKTLNR